MGPVKLFRDDKNEESSGHFWFVSACGGRRDKATTKEFYFYLTQVDYVTTFSTFIRKKNKIIMENLKVLFMIKLYIKYLDEADDLDTVSSHVSISDPKPLINLHSFSSG